MQATINADRAPATGRATSFAKIALALAAALAIGFGLGQVSAPDLQAQHRVVIFVPEPGCPSHGALC